MRLIITAALGGLALAVSACAKAINMHVTTEVVFHKLTLGVSMGYYDTQVPDNEALTMLCGAPTPPVAMVAGCEVGSKPACETKSGMLAFTTVNGHAGDVRLTLEAAGVAVVNGGIVTDQRVVCDVQRTRLVDGARATVPSNASSIKPIGMSEVQASSTFKMAGTDSEVVAEHAKDFSDVVVATAPSIGPFSEPTTIDVRPVDASGTSCSPKTNLPYMVLQDVSSQDGPLSCEPIEGDDCKSMRCLLPATATRLSVTLRPSASSAKSNDALRAQVLVVPSGSP